MHVSIMPYEHTRLAAGVETIRYVVFYFRDAMMSSCDQFHIIVPDDSEMEVPLWDTFLLTRCNDVILHVSRHHRVVRELEVRHTAAFGE